MVTSASALTNADASKSFFIFVTDKTGRIRRVLLPADVQIGRKDVPAALQLTGRVAVSLRDVTVGDSSAGTVQVGDDDTILGVSLDPAATVTSLTVMLPPAPVDGQLHFVKDVSGTANSVPVVVSASVGTIDGQSAVTITTALGKVGIAWSAGARDWHVISDSMSGSSSSGNSDASYVVLGLTGSLSNARVLAAGTGIVITDGGANGDVTVSAYASSSLPMMVHLPIVAGTQSVDQVVFQAVSAFEFNPDGPESMAPPGSTSYTAYFQPIVEVLPKDVTLETQLYNVGLNSYVSESLLSCSQLGATRLKSSNLSGSLAGGSNTYEMHMRITSDGAGTAYCKGAKLLVTWQ